MRNVMIPAVLTVFLSAALLAQSANPKTPQVKSQKEAAAVTAVFQAADNDARLKAIDDLLTKFADTQFKAFVCYIGAEVYRSKGDQDNMIIWAERSLEADPKQYASMILIGQGLASRTREFDLDKDDKLTRSDKLATQALGMIDQTVKPNAQMTDEQFTVVKKEFASQAHEVLALSALVRKKYDVAEKEFQLAIEMSDQPNPSNYVRLGMTRANQQKYDEAIASFDKALNDPTSVAVVKKAAMDAKMSAIKAKQAQAAPPKQEQPAPPKQ